MAIEDYLTVAAPTNELIETDAVIVGAVPLAFSRFLNSAFLRLSAT